MIPLPVRLDPPLLPVPLPPLVGVVVVFGATWVTGGVVTGGVVTAGVVVTGGVVTGGVVTAGVVVTGATLWCVVVETVPACFGVLVAVVWRAWCVAVFFVAA